MRQYFFHLAFELFPDPKTLQHPVPTFNPPANLDIFSASLPAHGTSNWASHFAPRKTLRRTQSSNAGLDDRISLSHRHRSPQTASSRVADDDFLASHLGDRHTSKAKAVRYPPSRAPLACATEQDWRFDQVMVESINMERRDIESSSPVDTSKTQSTKGTVADNLTLRGKYVASNPKTTEFGYGVVHLYRDAEPATGMPDGTLSTLHSQGSTGNDIDEDSAFVDKDCTTLCILAVPSYMSPSDLLGWLGEDTRENVSHLRLVRTSRSNRYMALMKFREAAAARQWQKDWNGKLFDSMEVCQHFLSCFKPHFADYLSQQSRKTAMWSL